jgi:Mn2+/Fe2+ NRAMP family transporter
MIPMDIRLVTAGRAAKDFIKKMLLIFLVLCIFVFLFQYKGIQLGAFSLGIKLAGLANEKK